jgi:phage terminase large subunit-like protein
VRPAHLARESGYERAHLLHVRIGRIEPTPACAVGIVYALRRLAHEAVVLADVFPPANVEAAWRERRAIVRAYHPFEHRAVRAVFRQGGRRG